MREARCRGEEETTHARGGKAIHLFFRGDVAWKGEVEKQKGKDIRGGGRYEKQNGEEQRMMEHRMKQNGMERRGEEGKGNEKGRGGKNTK